MWPGMRPATGWMANFTSTPRLVRAIVQLADAVLGLGHGHAVAGDDDHGPGGVHDLGRVFGRGALGRPLLDGRRWRPAPGRMPPNSTLANERFIALHMMIERIRPDEPSKAPAAISRLFFKHEAHRHGRQTGVGSSTGR